jgi:hypothetical protein
MSRAQQLIEALDIANIGIAIRAVDMSSSSHCDYRTQKAKWERVAQLVGANLFQISNAIANDQTGLLANDPSGFTGIEGLWELTKDKKLWPLTDYAMAGETDQYAYSYFYGASDERIKAWERVLGKNHDLMAKSFAHCVGGTACGRLVIFDRNFKDCDYYDPEDAKEMFTSMVKNMVKTGWQIEDLHEQGMVIFGGGTAQSEVGRMLDQ